MLSNNLFGSGTSAQISYALQKAAVKALVKVQFLSQYSSGEGTIYTFTKVPAVINFHMVVGLRASFSCWLSAEVLAGYCSLDAPLSSQRLPSGFLFVCFTMWAFQQDCLLHQSQQEWERLLPNGTSDLMCHHHIIIYM